MENGLPYSSGLPSSRTVAGLVVFRFHDFCTARLAEYLRSYATMMVTAPVKWFVSWGIYLIAMRVRSFEE